MNFVRAFLKVNQAVIDAWFAYWLKQQCERIEKIFAKKIDDEDTS